MDIDHIKQELAQIDQVRQRINKFIIAALPTMGPDCLKLVVAISAMVAQGGASPSQIMGALDDLNQINDDFTTAIAAVKAQEGAPAPAAAH